MDGDCAAWDAGSEGDGSSHGGEGLPVGGGVHAPLEVGPAAVAVFTSSPADEAPALARGVRVDVDRVVLGHWREGGCAVVVREHSQPEVNGGEDVRGRAAGVVIAVHSGSRHYRCVAVLEEGGQKWAGEWEGGGAPGQRASQLTGSTVGEPAPITSAPLLEVIEDGG